MRLTDLILRRGHLSERTLLEALTSLDRPDHLDHCDVCTARATALNAWLDEVRAVGRDAADAAFSDDQLKVQRAQVMARLAHEDEPSRVLSFPGRPVAHRAAGPAHRVAPVWLGVAAAAGIVLGVIGGQVTARMGFEAVSLTPASAATEAAPAAPAAGPAAPVFDPLEMDLQQYTPTSLQDMHELMPVLVAAAGG